MRNSVSDVTDAEILDETREAMTQAAFDAADEANAAQAVESATESLPAFDELGLSDEMLRAIENLGYTAPTPVQAGSIPVVLEGRDLLAAAHLRLHRGKVAHRLFRFHPGPTGLAPTGRVENTDLYAQFGCCFQGSMKHFPPFLATERDRLIRCLHLFEPDIPDKSPVNPGLLHRI